MTAISPADAYAPPVDRSRRNFRHIRVLRWTFRRDDESGRLRAGADRRGSRVRIAGTGGLESDRIVGRAIRRCADRVSAARDDRADAARRRLAARRLRVRESHAALEVKTLDGPRHDDAGRMAADVARCDDQPAGARRRLTRHVDSGATSATPRARCGGRPVSPPSPSSSSRSASAPTARCSAWSTPRSSAPFRSPNPIASSCSGSARRASRTTASRR